MKKRKQEIDGLKYNLYGLTQDKISIAEGQQGA